MEVAVRRARCCLAGLLVAAGALVMAPPAHATAVPGYNGRIAFTRNAGAGADATGIYTVNADGTGLTQLTHNSGVFTSYRGDGSQIGYQATGGIAVMDADGTNQHTVLPGEQAAIRLSWSPDASKFTWMESINGQPVITVENADATDKHRVLDDGGSRWYPTWSPDGHQIAFWDAGANEHIGIVNADGSNEHAVIATAHTPDYVSFSPDGTKLVYGENTGSQGTATVLHVVNVDGTDDHTIGDLTGSSSTAAWAPDGQWIAFLRGGAAADHGIWIIRADGTGARQLTHSDDLFPDWQPLASTPANLPPRAIGTAQNKQPLALFANADASWDFDGTITSYEWRWGDNTAMSPHKYAWHKYAAAGTYLVRLTVTDNDGAKTTKKAWVKVS